MNGNIQLKQVILGAFLLALFISVGLFSFLIIVLALSQYIPIISSVDEKTSGLVNISATIILAFLTAIYVFITYQIVAQSATDQKIRFIERKLEKLYYPMRTALKGFDVGYVSDNIKEAVANTEQGGTGGAAHNAKNIISRLMIFKKDSDKASPYLYMASNELESPLMKLINFVESNKLFVENWGQLDDTERAIKAISLVNDDIIAKWNDDVDFIVGWHTQSLEVIEADMHTLQKKLAMLVK